MLASHLFSSRLAGRVLALGARGKVAALLGQFGPRIPLVLTPLHLSLPQVGPLRPLSVERGAPWPSSTAPMGVPKHLSMAQAQGAAQWALLGAPRAPNPAIARP